MSIRRADYLVGIAKQLGVSLRDVGDLNQFPVRYLQSQITPGKTTRDQVHSIMRVAHARLTCEGGSEKYLFGSAQYDLANQASAVLDIFYDLPPAPPNTVYYRRSELNP